MLAGGASNNDLSETVLSAMNQELSVTVQLR